jgi:cytochrome c556
MAERQRFATRMIQPGNPMQFSPRVPQQQGDSARLNQMGQVAESLMSLSKSFAGAFRAGAEVSEREYLRQQKVEQQILEEQKTADILRGKFVAQQKGVMSPNFIENETPAFKEGYKTEIYSSKIDDDNEYIKALAPNLADKIYARWSSASKEKANKGEQYIPLAEYASVFIQKEKEGLMQGYQNDPVAWKVFSEKGLDFGPLQDALAKHMGEEADTRRKTVLSQRVQRIHKNNHKTYGDYESAASNVRLEIDGISFYTNAEEQNAFLEDKENQLKIATSPDDPVFQSLDFVFNSQPSDGIGFKLSQSQSTNSNYKTVSQRFYKLVENLRIKKEKLEKEQEDNNKTSTQKDIDQLKRDATTLAGEIFGQIQEITTKPEALELQKKINSAEFIAKFREGTSSNSGITLTKLQEAIETVVNSTSLNPSRFTPSEEESSLMRQLKAELQSLASSAKSSPTKQKDIDRYAKSLLKYSKYEGYPELSLLFDKVKENKTEYEKKVKDEQGELYKEKQSKAVDEHVQKLYNDLGKIQRGQVPYTAQAIKAIEKVLGENLDPKYEPIRKLLTKTVQDINTSNKTKLFEDNGVEAVAKAERLTADPNVTVDTLQTAVDQVRYMFNIDAGDKKTAIKTLYDRMFEINSKTLDDETKKKKLELREKIYKNSEKMDKLTEYIKEAKDSGYDDLMKEAQGYVSVLNSRAYTKGVKDEERNRQKTQKTKQDIARGKSFSVYDNLSTSLALAVENNDQKQIKKLRKDFDVALKGPLGADPGLQEMLYGEFKNAAVKMLENTNETSKRNKAIELKKKAKESQEKFQEEQTKTLQQVNQLIVGDNPNFTKARELIASRFNKVDYNDETKELETSNPTVFGMSQQSRLYDTVRVEEYKYKLKTTDVKTSTDPGVVLTIEKDLYNFPEQKAGESDDSFDKRAEDEHAKIYKKLADAYTGGKLLETSFNRLKRSLDTMLEGGIDARKERFKNDPINIINTRRKALYLEVGKSDAFYFSLPGAATFLENIQESRNEVYKDLLIEYDTAISEEYETNPEFNTNKTVRRNRTKEIYETVLENNKARIEQIKEQLNKLETEATDEGFDVRDSVYDRLKQMF